MFWFPIFTFTTFLPGLTVSLPDRSNQTALPVTSNNLSATSVRSGTEYNTVSSSENMVGTISALYESFSGMLTDDETGVKWAIMVSGEVGSRLTDTFDES